MTPTSSMALERGSSLWKDAFHRLQQNKLAVLCLIIFVFIAVLCIVGPWLSPYSESQTDLNLKATGPSKAHWFGTDQLGRDLLVRVMEGGRISLAVGLAATLVSVLIGVAYGATAGYLGGKTDAALMRIVDVLFGIPFIIFVILLRVVMDPILHTPWQKLMVLFLAIGAVEWLTMARIVRGQVLTLSKMEFTEAARSLGLSSRRIIFAHLIPNTLGPVIVYSTLTVPAVMLTEAVLSFIGLGVEPPQSSWGLLIKDGAAAMETYPWLLVFPAILFALSLFCLNFAGDGLRDALDVKGAKD